MTSTTRRLFAALILGGFAAICVAEGNAADDKKVPTVNEIMKKANDTKRGANKGLTTKISAAAADEKWDDAQKMAKELKELGAVLGKNTPKKGDKDGWKEKCEQYTKETAAVADAADKKDAKAVKAAIMALGNSCKACHKDHQ